MSADPTDQLPDAGEGELRTALAAWRRRAISERTARGLGWMNVLLGVGVLAGWLLGVRFLRAPIPGLPEMKPNSAAGLLLAGTALVALAARPPGRVPRVLAVVAALGAAAVGGLTLVEHILATSIGIDELLADVPGAADAGRPALQTAVCLLLGGAALALLDAPARLRRLAAPLGFAVVAVAMFTVLSYAYGGDQSSSFGGFTPGALHTGVGLLALGVGIVLARPEQGVISSLTSEGSGGTLARRLVPVVLVGLPLIGWLRHGAEDVRAVEPGVGTAALVTVAAVPLVLTLLASARAVDRAESARRQSALLHQRLVSVVEQSEDAIFTTSLDGDVTSWNRGAERLYGYTPDEMIGRAMTTLVAGARSDGATDAPDALGPIAKHRRKDGAEIDVAVTLSPLRGEDGATVGVSLIARDVTESLRAEREALEARAEAERANHAKSEFLSRMSHELRTPLNAILGFGQLLQLDETDERRRENVAHILRGGNHLLDLINEVLDISRIESGTMTVSVEPVGLEEVIDEARDLVVPLANERGIHVETQLAAQPAWVAADRQRLKQVLLNLLSNAVKYNRPNGSITLAVKDGAEGRLRVLVSDSGFGIPPLLVDRLFTPFDRLGAEQSKVEGTGLGLALTKSLVEAMGGTIEVESKEGEGSTFIVDLAAAESPLERVREQGPVYTAAAGTPAGAGSEATILYVEDNVSNLKLVEQILARRPGVTLIPAMKGELGLELARKHRPRLILLDLHLPDLQGSQVLARLKTDPETRHIPVAMLSADATAGQVERLLAIGADDYLTKPLDIPAFMALLDKTLDLKEAVAT